MPSQVEMIGDDKYIGCAKVDQRADIQTKIKVRDDADEMRHENEEDELVEPYRLFPFGRCIVIPQAGIDYILVKGLNKYEWVAHRIRIRVFLPPYT